MRQLLKSINLRASYSTAIEWLRCYRFPLLTMLCVLILRTPYVFVSFQHPDEGTFLTFGAQSALRGDAYGADYLDGRGPGMYLLATLLTKLFGFGDTRLFHWFGLFYFGAIHVFTYLIAHAYSGRVNANLTLLLLFVFSFAFNIPDAVFTNVEVLALLPLLISIYFYVIWAEKGRESDLFVSFFSMGLVFSIRQAMAISIVPLGLCSISKLKTTFTLAPVRYDCRKLVRLALVVLCGFVAGSVIGFAQPILHGQLRAALYASVIHGFRHPVMSWPSKVMTLFKRFTWFGFMQPFLWTLALASVTSALGREREREREREALFTFICV